MPWIITTTTPCARCDGDGGALVWEDSQIVGSRACQCDAGNTISRRAAATLNEALVQIVLNVRALNLKPADPGWSHGLVWAQVDGLPSTGGTIGPLPDGTTIEVKRVPLGDLMRRMGWGDGEPRALWPEYEVIPVFNEAKR